MWRVECSHTEEMEAPHEWRLQMIEGIPPWSESHPAVGMTSTRTTPRCPKTLAGDGPRRLTDLVDDIDHSLDHSFQCAQVHQVTTVGDDALFAPRRRGAWSRPEIGGENGHRAVPQRPLPRHCLSGLAQRLTQLLHPRDRRGLVLGIKDQLQMDVPDVLRQFSGVLRHHPFATQRTEHAQYSGPGEHAHDFLEAHRRLCLPLSLRRYGIVRHGIDED
mgnify:CR=1 FL=1